MTKRKFHIHLIIKQIIPAPEWMRTVEAYWPIIGHESIEVDDVEVNFNRVPCLALVADCSKRYDDDPESCGPDEDTERIVPCVQGDYDHYLPLGDFMAMADNTPFLGIEDSPEPKMDGWRAAAAEAFQKWKKEEAKRKADKELRQNPDSRK